MAKKVLVVGITGWWSNIFGCFRRPITLVFQDLKFDRHITKKEYHWRDYLNAVDYIWVNRTKYDYICLLGHSYGASACTLVADRLSPKQNVELLISLDQGLDSSLIVDRPIRNNVKQVDEYRVGLEKLQFANTWQGRHLFVQLPRLSGHTAAFTKDKMVKRIANRIRGLTNE